jgi:hypothetical protein
VSVDPTKLTRTRIIWVCVTDPQGQNPKTRAAVILYPPPDDSPDSEFQVACSSRTPPDPKNAEGTFYLDGMQRPGGHPRTGLTEGGWVRANWIRTVKVGEVERLAKFMPEHQFVELYKVVKAAGLLILPPPSSPPPPPPAAPPPPPAAPPLNP